MLPPIYYLGWIIQATPNGIFCYQRIDSAVPQYEIWARNIICAVMFIGSAVKGG